MTGSGDEDLFPSRRLNRPLSVQLRDLRRDAQRRARRTGSGRPHLRGEFPRVLICVLLGAQPPGRRTCADPRDHQQEVNFMFKLHEAESLIVIRYEGLEPLVSG